MIQHCDEFHGLFSAITKVKCLADAGLFLDAYVFIILKKNSLYEETVEI